MYARSTTFHGRPANIDAGIEFVKNEAGPMLDKIEGWTSTTTERPAKRDRSQPASSRPIS